MTTKLSVRGGVSLLSLVILFASACSQSVTTKPQRVSLLNERGVTLAESGLWEEAHFYWQRAHELDSENPKILNNLGVWHEREGRVSLAEQFYRKALTLEGNLEVVRANLEASLTMQQAIGAPVGGKNDEQK